MQQPQVLKAAKFPILPLIAASLDPPRMRRFKSPGHAQRFCSSYELIRQHFHPKQHLLPATEYRQQMCQRFESWRELTGTQAAT